jgi:tetratricopeptide (TPR) repeat protein
MTRKLGFALALVALAAATFAAFAGVRHNGWVLLDDPVYVTENPHVLAGWTRAGLLWFLHAPHGANWHPLTSYSHMLDVQLFGVNAGAHHAVSLAFHVVNAVLLVVVLARLTGSPWRSLLVGALFALHPLRVESVAWASERKDVLSMLFFLLTLEAWRQWVQRPSALRHGAVIVALALGLMSKPMLVTTPLVLLLLDLWPLRRWRGWPNVIEKWPLFAMAAASAAITFVVQRSEGAVVTVANTSIEHRFANAAVSYWRYVGKTLWPSRLAPFYPDHAVPALAWITSVLALAVVTVLAVRQARSRPWLTVGWLWYAITLLPVIGIVQVGGQGFADRYTYLPGIGLLVALIGIPLPRAAERVAFGSGIAVALLLGALTRRQVALWKDTTTLFTETVRVTRDNAMAHSCLAAALVSQGRDEQAIHEYEEAIRIAPAYVNPYLGLAELLRRHGRDAEARPYYANAVRYYEQARASSSDPELAADEALSLLGAGRIDDATALYRQMLERDPSRVDALRQLGIVLASRHELGEALPLLQRAAALAPRDAEVQLALGKAIYASGGSATEAIAHLSQASELAPALAEAPSTLALILATDLTVRAPEEAVRLAARGVQLTHERDVDAWAAQVAAQLAAGQRDSAEASAHRALALADSTQSPAEAGMLRARLAGFAAREARLEAALPRR